MSPSKHTILIVSPESSDRERIAKICGEVATQTGLSLSVREEQDGLAAEDAVKAHKPALVVSEVLLDHQGGLEFARRIRSKTEGPQPRLIFVSHLASDMDRYWGLRCGAQAYVAKPFEDALLRDKITRILKDPTYTEAGKPG